MDRDADVIVVGAGLSGVVAAERLAEAGVHTHVLDAGPAAALGLPQLERAAFQDAAARLSVVDEGTWRYRSVGVPFDWQRVRAPGGRSLLWGGWCCRLEAQNLVDARGWGAPWPFPPEALDRHYQRAERMLATSEVPVDERFRAVETELGLPLAPKVAAVGNFPWRAVLSLDLRQRATVQPDQVALRVVLDTRGRAAGVEVMDPVTRATQVVQARAVVLCASPLETARLLLATAPGGPGPSSGVVGTGLVDHLVLGWLVVMPVPAPAAGALLPTERAVQVPRFVNRGRRGRRPYRGGFTLELRGPIALGSLDPAAWQALGVDAKEVDSLSYLAIHAMGECAPHPDRHLRLDPDGRDAWGRPLPVVSFAWGDAERAMAADMEQSALAVADVLAPPGSRCVPVRTLEHAAGAGHEAGTCRMGRSPRDSVTRLDGQVHGVPGLYVADAALMPTGLDRPPTLTVVALALNTADNVVEALARRDL